MTTMRPQPYIRADMLSVTDFRTHIAALLPRVENLPSRLVLTRHGRPYCAVVSMRDLEMIEKFDGHSVEQLRLDQDDVACRFAAAQEVGRTPRRGPGVRSL